MPLSSDQTTQVFQILGIPQGGTGHVIGSVATLFGPAYESYDMQAVVALVNARLAGLSAPQETRLTALLARWDAIGSTSPLRVNAAGDTRGELADHPAEREAIRHALADVAGIAVPAGGFAAEARRMTGGSGEISR